MYRKLFSLLLIGLMISGTVHADPSVYSGAPDPVKKESFESNEPVLAPAFGGQDTGASVNYHYFDLTDHSATSAGVRSLLVPGWGQAFNGQTRKGALMLGVTAVLAVSAFASYNDAQSSYSDYKASGRSDSSTYDDYSNKLNLSIILTGLTALMWGVSVYDAARNGSAAALSKAGTVQLTMNRQGEPEVVYERRF